MKENGGVTEITAGDLYLGKRPEQESVVKVEWLDEKESLQEHDLLCFTTTFGILKAMSEEFVGVANDINAVDGGEMLLIPAERVINIVVLDGPDE